jgi:hypothetical protein
MVRCSVVASWKRKVGVADVGDAYAKYAPFEVERFLTFEVLPKLFQHLRRFFDVLYRHDRFSLDDSYCSGMRVSAPPVSEALTAKDCGEPTFQHGY